MADDSVSTVLPDRSRQAHTNLQAAVWSGATFAGCLLIGALRDPAILRHPALGWDEKVIFGAFYAGRGGLLYLYPDYISLLQNSIFGVAFLFRTPEIPSALVLMSAGVQAFSASFFCLPMFDRLVPGAPRRAAICFLVAAMPVGNLSILSSPAYQNWTALAVGALIAAAWLSSCAVAVRQLPRSVLLVAVVCALSQPLSACLVPAYAAVGWAAVRGQNFRTAIQAAAMAAVSLAAGLEAFTLGRDAPHAGNVAIGRVLASVARAPLYMFDRGVLEAFVGPHWRDKAVSSLPAAGQGLAPALIYAAGGAIAAGIVLAALRSQDRELRLFVLTCLAVELCLATAILPALDVARPGFSGGMLTGLSRYWYAQRCLTLVAFGCLLCRWVGRRKPGPAIRSAGLVALALWIAAANVGQSEVYGRFANDAEWAQASRRQSAFLHWVEAGERSGAEGCRTQQLDEPEPRLRLELPRGRGGSSQMPCTFFSSAQ